MTVKSVDELIGRTPMLELENFTKAEGLEARLAAKLEYLNPTGSVKDRAALYMIDDAERRGLLPPGGTIIEPTSGNTGIGIASVGAARGYRVVIVMPETMTRERREMIAAYGAQVVLTPGSEGMAGAVAEAKRLCAQTAGAVVLSQFENPANSAAHLATTGPEIWEDCGGDIDIFVAGVGTGGTISGVGEFLKSQKPDLRIVAVEPQSSPLISQGRAGAHGIQGIGANFLPAIFRRELCDEVIAVPDDAAFETARKIAKTQGIPVGISSGAAVWAAAQLAKREENRRSRIVALLPDSGDRYLSLLAK